MAPDLLLGIDVGTQSVRAIAFDRSGRIAGRSQVAMEPPFEATQPGWAELDPAAYWQAVVAAVHGLWTEPSLSPERIAALALTTQRGTVVCAREDGTPLRPAIVWPDQRLCSAPPSIGPYWRTLFGLARAGAIVRLLQSQAEANWLAQHEPAMWQRCERFGLLSGWLTHRLVGDWVDSAACQVGYLPFDYRRQQWADAKAWQWKALAVRRSQLPRLVAPASALGELTPAAADALGLPPGLHVIAAAADKACEVLGCGVLEPGTAHLSFGTAATINTMQPNYIEVQRLLPAYPAALPGAFNTEIQIERGFWLIRWFKDEFAHHERALAAERGVSVESLFDALIDSVPAGAMGLVLQPYWSPGLREPGPEAKGAIIGFSSVHTRAHVYRAMIEGLLYSLRAGRERIETATRRPITRLVISGGGAQSDGAMQIAADVFDLVAERPDVAEASSLGAAILAATGIGWYSDTASATRAMVGIGKRFVPDAAAVRTYDALFREVYQPMYRRLQPLYRRLRTITGQRP